MGNPVVKMQGTVKKINSENVGNCKKINSENVGSRKKPLQLKYEHQEHEKNGGYSSRTKFSSLQCLFKNSLGS